MSPRSGLPHADGATSTSAVESDLGIDFEVITVVPPRRGRASTSTHQNCRASAQNPLFKGGSGLAWLDASLQSVLSTLTGGLVASWALRRSPMTTTVEELGIPQTPGVCESATNPSPVSFAHRAPSVCCCRFGRCFHSELAPVRGQVETRCVGQLGRIRSVGIRYEQLEPASHLPAEHDLHAVG